MANMFYHPSKYSLYKSSFLLSPLYCLVCASVGIIVYYIVICLYLYGDLAIYAVAIPKSMVVVVW